MLYGLRNYRPLFWPCCLELAACFGMMQVLSVQPKKGCSPWCVPAGACLSNGPLPHVPCSQCCDPPGSVPPCVSLGSRQPHSSLSYILPKLAIRHSTARPPHPARGDVLQGYFYSLSTNLAISLTIHPLDAITWGWAPCAHTAILSVPEFAAEQQAMQ